jgi:hypothetical protein
LIFILTRTLQYLKENAGAANVKLSSEEVASIREISVASEIPGDRYGEAYMEMVKVTTPELPQ